MTNYNRKLVSPSEMDAAEKAYKEYMSIVEGRIASKREISGLFVGLIAAASVRSEEDDNSR